MGMVWSLQRDRTAGAYVRAVEKYSNAQSQMHLCPFCKQHHLIISGAHLAGNIAELP